MIGALLRQGELDELHVRRGTPDPDDEWPSPAPGSVWLWLSAGGEVYTRRLVPDLASREGADGDVEALFHQVINQHIT